MIPVFLLSMRTTILLTNEEHKHQLAKQYRQLGYIHSPTTGHPKVNRGASH